MKILPIGNSFSVNSQTWLHDIAASAGVELTTKNLVIGGCPLEKHAANLESDALAYAGETNGRGDGMRMSILGALKSDDWDVVTLQQVSYGSGLPATWEPYFGKLYNAVRENCPSSKILLHETWEYESCLVNPCFEDRCVR